MAMWSRGAPARLALAGGLVACAAFCALAREGGDSSPRARIDLVLPDSKANVLVNGRPVSPGPDGSVLVRPGSCEVRITGQGVTRYAATFDLRRDQVLSLILDCRETCATIDVLSDPVGAAVFLNNEYAGNTPYVNSFVRTGEYDLRVDMPGYTSRSERLSLDAGSNRSLTFQLEHTPAWTDSVKAARRAQAALRRNARRLAFGVLAAGFGLSGIYFDAQASSDLDRAHDAAEEYDRAQSGFEQYKQSYGVLRQNALHAIGMRNPLYVLSGVCALGFCISIAF